MSIREDDIGYRIGYVLERLRTAPRRIPGMETLLGSPGASRGRGARSRNGGGALDRARVAARFLVPGLRRSPAERLVRRLVGSSDVTFGELALAAASGAGAAVVAELLAPLIGDDEEVSSFADRATPILEGIGRGLVYGGVVEPRLPGPAFLVGFAFGTAEYLTAAWGGLPHLLRSASPHRFLPLGSRLLEPPRGRSVRWVDMVVFGVALSLLYEGLRAKSGIVDEE